MPKQPKYPRKLLPKGPPSRSSGSARRRKPGLSVLPSLLVARGQTLAQLSEESGLHPVVLVNLVESQTGNLALLEQLAKSLGLSLKNLTALQKRHEEEPSATSEQRGGPSADSERREESE